MADTSPSREEIDAKLAAAEARTETRITQLQGSLDLNFAKLQSNMETLVTSVKEVKDDNKNTRTTVIAVVVGSVLAGLAALWASQANLLAAFQAGLGVKADVAQKNEQKK